MLALAKCYKQEYITALMHYAPLQRLRQEYNYAHIKMNTLLRWNSDCVFRSIRRGIDSLCLGGATRLCFYLKELQLPPAREMHNHRRMRQISKSSR
jgi:hypothetical protein